MTPIVQLPCLFFLMSGSMLTVPPLIIAHTYVYGHLPRFDAACTFTYAILLHLVMMLAQNVSFLYR